MQAGKRVALIGAGQMGTSMARGWLKARGGLRLEIIDPNPGPDVHVWVAEGKVTLNLGAVPADIVVLAVKPQVFAGMAPSIRGYVAPGTLVVSIMAGIELAQLRAALGTSRLVRAMPNTPGAIGQGVTVFAAPEKLSQKALGDARRLLRPLGEVLGPVDEALMPAVTALSGSGPAYLFLLAEVMAEAGIAEGLPADLANTLARRTVEGAAALMAQTDEAPLALRHAVTSPGGTTAAALDILMASGGMQDIMRRAMRAAADKARALARAAD